MNEAYARLQAQADAQQPSLINDYGATDPAEFFAVVSETFFEQAHHRPSQTRVEAVG